MASESNPASVHDRVVDQIFFSGEQAPGAKVVERALADRLGVSRIPIRESLGKLVGQGLLVGEDGGRGVRTRRYTTEEIRQLYEVREMLEGGVGRAAARAATDADITRMQMILQRLEQEVGHYGSKRWADLDHAFHDAMADASHNDRMARLLKLLLTECHYVLFLFPPRGGRPQPTEGDAPRLIDATAHMRAVYQEHVDLLDRISAGDCDGAERMAREHMRKSIARVTEAIIIRDLGS